MNKEETIKWIDAELCDLMIKKRWLESAKEFLQPSEDAPNNSQGKKDESDGSNENHLETRSKVGEEVKTSNMPMDVDNHLDTSKLKESKIADELNKDYENEV